MSEEYKQLVNEESKIGKRYLVKEIESLLIALQGQTRRIGELEDKLSVFLNRNQIKYLFGKLTTDHIVNISGVGRGTKYFFSEDFADLKGDVLLSRVLNGLRETYDDIALNP